MLSLFDISLVLIAVTIGFWGIFRNKTNTFSKADGGIEKYI